MDDQKKQRNRMLVKKPFNKGFEMLPAIYQKKVRLEIMACCGWSTEQTFINKKFGRVPIRPPEEIVVINIFKTYNLDPWTGKYLKNESGK